MTVRFESSNGFPALSPPDPFGITSLVGLLSFERVRLERERLGAKIEGLKSFCFRVLLTPMTSTYRVSPMTLSPSSSA